MFATFNGEVNSTYFNATKDIVATPYVPHNDPPNRRIIFNYAQRTRRLSPVAQTPTSFPLLVHHHRLRPEPDRSSTRHDPFCQLHFFSLVAQNLMKAS